MTARLTRRSFVRTAGVGALAFWVGGCRREMTPAQAREEAVPFAVLDDPQVQALEALGETLLPGSAEAGLAHFIDHQLNAPPAEQMLMIKYLGVAPPFKPFYLGGLAALDGAAQSSAGSPFKDLDSERQKALVAEMAASDPQGWDGPPAAFFYFVVRNDALDVTYGTMQGVSKLGLPYMAHIEPPSRWGE